jgi:ribonucleoside-diphosphate reductase alpha chain
MNDLQKLQFTDKYSRWNYEEGRRETWEEAVARASDYLRELSEDKLDESDYKMIHDAMLNMEAFSSMRLFAMAGDAARRNNLAIYNCSALGIDSIDAFCEVLLLSMSGCGVGFSVEERFVSQLPIVKPFSEFETMEEYEIDKSNYVVPDTTEGWVNALKLGLTAWFFGQEITFDFSEIRPQGSILKVKGGRASGAEPLISLLDFAEKTIRAAVGRKLTSLEVHDIVTKIGSCAISGGTRRSALISLFDSTDTEMLHSKDNGWWVMSPQRANANNTVVIDKELSRDEITKYMKTMHDGGGGEPGLMFRRNVNHMNPSRRKDQNVWLYNPCGEINLRHMQLCNLSQAILRPNDTFKSLAQKVRVATIIGTIQSMATHFPGMRDEWRQNCEEERLLGVDITGQMDNFTLLTEETFRRLRKIVIDTNRDYAAKLGINQSAATTCVKPSGNSSVLFGCSSGLHTRWSKYYIRRMRFNAENPIKKMLELSGYPLSPENGQKEDNATTFVVEFPQKSPRTAIVNGHRSAVQQLEWWKKNKVFWTEHNPSCTIRYTEDELDEMIDWLYDNQTIIGGLSFFPKDDHYYPQAPLEKITKKKYDEMIKALPDIDFDLLSQLEMEDMTTSAQELACFGGVCEI